MLDDRSNDAVLVAAHTVNNLSQFGLNTCMFQTHTESNLSKHTFQRGLGMNRLIGSLVLSVSLLGTSLAGAEPAEPAVPELKPGKIEINLSELEEQIRAYTLKMLNEEIFNPFSK